MDMGKKLRGLVMVRRREDRDQTRTINTLALLSFRIREVVVVLY